MSKSLACLFAFGVRISWKQWRWKRAMAAESSSGDTYLLIWRMNYSKLS